MFLLPGYLDLRDISCSDQPQTTFREAQTSEAQNKPMRTLFRARAAEKIDLCANRLPGAQIQIPTTSAENPELVRGGLANQTELTQHKLLVRQHTEIKGQ